MSGFRPEFAGWQCYSPRPLGVTRGMYVANRSMKTGLFLGAIALIASIGVSADPQGTSVQASPNRPAPESSAPQASAGPTGPALQASVPDAALVQKYCLTCHSARVKTAGLSLEDMNP